MNNERPFEAINERIRNANGGAAHYYNCRRCGGTSEYVRAPGNVPYCQTCGDAARLVGPYPDEAAALIAATIRQRVREANGGAIPWLPVTDDPLLCGRCAAEKHPYDTCERCGGKLCPACCEFVTGVRNA